MDKNIMVRAAITDAEWAAVRKLAIDKGTTPPKLIAVWIRKGLPRGSAA